MSKTIYQIILILFLNLFFSCKDDPVSLTDIKLDGIIPLAIGNTWISRIDSLNTNGLIVESKFDTTTITKDTVVGGERWFTTNKDGVDYVTNRSDGFYFTLHHQLLWYKYPANIGDSVKIDEHYVRKVASISDTVFVNQTRYIVYKYIDSVPTDKDIVNHYWYIAPHIGIIKYELVNPKTNSVFYRSEIISYTIK